MTIQKLFVWLVVVAGLGYGSWRVWHTSRVQDWLLDRQKSRLPPAEQIAESIAAPALNAAANRRQILNLNESAHVPDFPAEKNLAIPFTSQAPHANWDTDHNEFCEEAAVLMVGRYFQRRPIRDRDDAEAALQQLKAWELDQLGFYYDTTAAETAQMLVDFYELRVEAITNPTVDDIKRAVASGQPVIVPAAGRELGNPNFRSPGPIYHMLVIRGYTDDGQFITNDPGTRNGEEYVYDQEVVMNAIHDWVPSGDRTVPRNGDVRDGQKVVLIVAEQ
ncbi:MAG: C39 family peptidase [Candidatus Kerfeldbacteria bacterium]|nr:C39 family peptidase [Candidatus Kerfeldbacteria bacterium]